MDALEKSLYQFIGRELHELIWKRHYSLHHSTALWAFLEAFRGSGVSVESSGTEAQFTFTTLLGKKAWSLQATLSFDEILQGWKFHPAGCPGELYNSMHIVYDQIGEQLPRKAADAWERKRHIEPKGIRQKMKEILLPYFQRHHEHLLLPASGDQPELGEPEIIRHVLADFPLELYERADRDAAIGSSDVRCTPMAETLYDILTGRDSDSFDEEYYPSESCLTELFWGYYLARLSEKKEYPLEHPTRHPVRYFASRGEDGLREGKLIWNVHS